MNKKISKLIKKHFPDQDDAQAEKLFDLVVEAMVMGGRKMFEDKPEHWMYTSKNDGVWSFKSKPMPRYWPAPGGTRIEAEMALKKWLRYLMTKD